MGTIIEKLGRWPRNQKNEPIFKTGEDAIFYATLIQGNKIFMGQVRKMRRDAIKEVKEQKKKRSINLDKLYVIAMKGQFARECLEEVVRLDDQDLQSKLIHNRQKEGGE